MGIETLITFIAATALLSFAPGPDNIFVLTQSAMHGKKAGIIITLGLCTGLIVHTLAVALGVATIIMVSSLAFNLLKFIGASYLLYLAWHAFKASNAEIDTRNLPPLSTAALYRRGIIMNLSNPKVAIFFLAFLPQFTEPSAGDVTLQLIVLGVLFIVVGFCCFLLIAILAGQLSNWLKQTPKLQSKINRLASFVFFALAVRLAFTTA